MEEKKKRWRPSLTAYRALENEVSELKEGMTALKSENVSLKQSNDMLEKEIYRLRENVSKYEKGIRGVEGQVVSSERQRSSCQTPEP